jgi:hypothetical protein
MKVSELRTLSEVSMAFTDDVLVIVTRSWDAEMHSKLAVAA